MPLAIRQNLLVAILGFAILGGTGCVRQVTIVSDPAAATARKNSRALGSTPVELNVLWLPFAKQSVRVGMTGYRGEKIYIGRNLGLFRQKTKHEVILIRGHGAAGTWTPEEAGQN